MFEAYIQPCTHRTRSQFRSSCGELFAALSVWKALQLSAGVRSHSVFEAIEEEKRMSVLVANTTQDDQPKEYRAYTTTRACVAGLATLGKTRPKSTGHPVTKTHTIALVPIPQSGDGQVPEGASSLPNPTWRKVARYGLSSSTLYTLSDLYQKQERS
jgi:hypothetical protein